MEISLDALPEDPAALRAMILTQQQKIVGMEAANRALEALIQALKLTIARLKRQKHGGELGEDRPRDRAAGARSRRPGDGGCCH